MPALGGGSGTGDGTGIDPKTFRTVLGQICTGITILTTVDDGAPVGFACQSFGEGPEDLELYVR